MGKTTKPDVSEALADPVDGPVEAVQELVVGLTERERLFADAFFEVAMERGTDVGSSKIAYRRAFPSSPVHDGSALSLANSLIRNERVRQHIAFLRSRYSDRIAIPVERVKQEIERVAFANPLDFLVIDAGTGRAQIDLRGMSSATAAAIAEITVTEKDGPDGIMTRDIKIKMNSKMDALDKLSRIHGIYQDKMNVTFTVDELDAAIRNMEQRIEQQKLSFSQEETKH